MQLSGFYTLVLLLFLAHLPNLAQTQGPIGSEISSDQEELETRLMRQAQKGDYKAYAETALELGGLFAHRGESEEAISLYEQAAELCHKNGEYKWFAILKKSISEIDFMTDRQVKAFALLDSLSRLPEIPDYELTAILFRLGDLHCDLGNYDTCRVLLERSLALAISSDYDILLGSIYTELGMAENAYGSKIAAIDYLIKAIPHLSAPRHSGVLCHNYLILSDLFDEIHQREKSDEYLAKATDIVADNQYHRLYHRVLYKEAMRDIERGDESGIQKLNSILEYNIASNLPVKAANIALDLAAEYIDLGQAEKAKQFLDQGWQLIKNDEPTIQHAKFYENLSKYCLLIGDLPGARIAFSENRKFFNTGGHNLISRNMALEIALLQAEGNYKRALEKYGRYDTYKDSLNSILQNQVLFDIEAKYQKEENEKAIALLSAQNKIKDLSIQQASRRSLMLLLGLVALALIAGVSLYTYRVKQRLNTQLVDKNYVITKSLAEKELLLREIHHRVKNNLEVISSLLYLQSKYIDDEQVLDAIREGQNRVRSMSLIHKNLYQEENLTGVEIHTYLEKLVDGLMKSYKIGDSRIDVKKEIAPLNLDVDTAIPLALIINELISNSLKYAFPEGKSGMVSISLEELNKELVLTVEDNGIGLPSNFEISSGKSLGYKLIDMFTKKLEGTLEIIGIRGTKITLKVSKYRIV